MRPRSNANTPVSLHDDCNLDLFTILNVNINFYDDLNMIDMSIRFSGQPNKYRKENRHLKY